MKKDDHVIRVNESDQFIYLSNGYSYVPKSEWKKELNTNKKDEKSDKTD